jgi:uncharacterized YigZ family protein
MDELAEYKTIEQAGRSVVREKASAFYGAAMHCDDVIKTARLLDSVKKEHPKASHYCCAWLINGAMRINDDGEPSGTAGRPIMDRIRSLELNNVMVIVTRYYGGTKLGTSGLIQCYGKAAEQALSDAVIHIKKLPYQVDLKFPYSVTGDVDKMIHRARVKVLDASYQELSYIKFVASGREAFDIAKAFENMHGVSVTISKYEKEKGSGE